jgi:DNA-binding winged helix-turn-helix (wHTH) protein/TolB-like protein
MNDQTIYIGQWRINSNNNTLVFEDEEIKLENKPMQLLLFLAENPGINVSKNDIFETVWKGRIVTDDVLSVAISHIRKALSDNARNPKFIKTIQGFGYCLIAPVLIENNDKQKSEKESSLPEKIITSRRSISGTQYSILAGIALLLILLVLTLNGSQPISEQVTTPSKHKVLAILPIASYSDKQAHQHLSDSLTEILISEFAKRANWRVISHTSVERFKDSNKNLPEIAKELGADLVVEGSLITSGTEFVVSLQLIDAKSDTHYWAERFNYLQQPNYSKQEEIAEQSINSIAEIFPKGIKAHNNRLTDVSTNTNERYEKAHQLMKSTNNSDWQQALSITEQTVVISPNYAPLYVLMAQAKIKILNVEYGQLDKRIPEYRVLLNKALELDPQLAMTHTELASLYFLADWQFDKAEYHFKQAISLNPNTTDTRIKYLNFLLAMKRFADAMQQVRIIRQLDPLAYSIPMMAWGFNMQRKYDEALLETHKLLNLNPNRFSYLWSAQSISENMADIKKSTLHMLRLLETVEYDERERQQIKLAANKDGLSGIYYWLLHLKKETRNIGQYLPPMSFARYALSSGNNQLALDYLEQAFDSKQVEILWIDVDPKYDALRGEPRFKSIISKLGL